MEQNDALELAWSPPTIRGPGKCKCHDQVTLAMTKADVARM